MRRLLPCAFLLALAACAEEPPGGGDTDADASARDATQRDAGGDGSSDSGVEEDLGVEDAGNIDVPDASIDAGPDAGTDAGPDAEDAEPTDADPPDLGVDAGSIEDLSDEFDDSATFMNWSLRDVVEGTPAQYTVLDIDTTTTDHLTIVPTASHWLNDTAGVFMFKTITGDFVMRTQVSTWDTMFAGQSIMVPYNTAGLMARDPAGATGPENWIEIANGYTSSFTGAIDMSTANSVSDLSEVPTSNPVELQICRLQDLFKVYYRSDASTDWTLAHNRVRPDLPATLQVGVAVNAYMTARIRAELDWIRFARPSTEADCTMDIPPR
jgi:hypothetical protein